jgi:hypothetical protein
MNNSLANDYFSFMSDKGEAKGRPPTAGPKPSSRAVKPTGDIIEALVAPVRGENCCRGS